jgi:P27 family predicted phage terminase small subunit
VPARKKPPGTQQDRRPQRSRVTSLEVVRAEEVEVPAPPDPPGGLLKSTKEVWRKLFEASAAKAIEPVDHAVAERWLLARDEWQRALNAFRRKRLVQGSTGQPVLNPLATWIQSREAVMAKCEQVLGIGPKFRADLGFTAGKARLTVAQLNAMAEEGEPDSGDEDDDAEEAELLEEFEAEGE